MNYTDLSSIAIILCAWSMHKAPKPLNMVYFDKTSAYKGRKKVDPPMQHYRDRVINRTYDLESFRSEIVGPHIFGCNSFINIWRAFP